MLGAYDFCGHYEWTFGWLARQGGDALVRRFWAEAIAADSQRHLAALVREEGFAGMQKYWAHTLADESPAREYTLTEAHGVFRIDMHACPSRGFLLRNGLAHFPDYCDHCIGWIGPVMREAGFVIDHEHNHCGQCWWEMRRKGDAAPRSGVGDVAAENDVRAGADWRPSEGTAIDRYHRATDSTAKEGST